MKWMKIIALIPKIVTKILRHKEKAPTDCSVGAFLLLTLVEQALVEQALEAIEILLVAESFALMD